jgi:hypothetical protein
MRSGARWQHLATELLETQQAQLAPQGLTDQIAAGSACQAAEPVEKFFERRVKSNKASFPPLICTNGHGR